MGCLMYYKDDSDRLGIEEFFLPFGGKLKKDNRWVKAAEIMPWSYIEEVYLRSMNQEIGRAAFPARIAYGAIYVKQQEQLTDEETVTAIAENPYIQYFLGLKEFRDEPLFDASMMVHFRKRFPFEELAKINEYICTGKRPEEEQKDDDGSNDPPSGVSHEEKQSQAGKPNKNTSRKKQKRKRQASLGSGSHHVQIGRNCENRGCSQHHSHERRPSSGALAFAFLCLQPLRSRFSVNPI